MAGAGALTVKLKVVHYGTGLWCPACLLPSGMCIRGWLATRWVTLRWCRDCGRPLNPKA